MTFIRTTPEQQAEGPTAEMYEEHRDPKGNLPNYALPFSHRPGLMDRWNDLLIAVRETMSLRRYELTTLSAAYALSSSYCVLAHGTVLLSDEFSEDDLLSILTETDPGPLTREEMNIMAYAAKIARDAASIEQEDIDALRAHGLSDTEIFDIASVASARCFFSKILDAVGTRPDAEFSKLSEPLRTAMTPGRRIAD